jgi:hypothetical protein
VLKGFEAHIRNQRASSRQERLFYVPLRAGGGGGVVSHSDTVVPAQIQKPLQDRLNGVGLIMNLGDRRHV